MALKLWWEENIEHWVIAESPEDAATLLQAVTEMRPEEFDFPLTWREWTKPLTMFEDEAGSCGITRSPEDWITQKGRGWLAMAKP